MIIGKPQKIRNKLKVLMAERKSKHHIKISQSVLREQFIALIVHVIKSARFQIITWGGISDPWKSKINQSQNS